MMRRAISTILVLLQLAQGLAFAHSHTCDGVAEPAQHAQRPHIHFGSIAAHQHDHDHGHPHEHDQTLVPNQATLGSDATPDRSHDSDAIYVSKDALSDRTANRVILPLWQILCLSSDTIALAGSPGALIVARQALPPPFSGQFDCPIILQTLALLI